MAELVRFFVQPIWKLWSILLPPFQHMIMLKFYLLCQHYASIMSAEWKYQLCPKLCWHNSLRPGGGGGGGGKRKSGSTHGIDDCVATAPARV